ncbi:MAG: bifunctional hydroxymethylpyrimidine kinase/phosphomethylpyrimidine kinase [Acidobacteria bacterium RIFCSPLOWO2_02_FULL_65_29]|nr:MAG: bifunctional hydroxymethylpyrimidine kinase/phosphomethylpyrimidine kinase [Acidobacteria bacterium RIFCSPLOWO2_02_FULL_65_29]
MRSALTIAGSDSGGGAGIQADLKTFAAFGVYGTSAVAAITAQNTMGVTAVMAVSADLVTAQIAAVASDIELHATKTGMLATAAIVEAVAAAIEELDLPNVVVDPVMVAKSGERLLDNEGIQALRMELLPRALVVTPNIPEAEVLSGLRISSLDSARDAARRIQELGPAAVVIKGGHGTGDEIIDLLFDGEQFHEYRTPRLATRHTHGTGCTFASAIAASLAHGHPLTEATRRAQAYVAGAIRHGLAIGHGHGPLDHFWQTRARESPPM